MKNATLFTSRWAGRAATLAATWLLTAAPAQAQAPTAPAAPLAGLPFWEWQAPQPTGFGLNDFWAFNDSTVLAVGNHGTALKTTNAGRSWRALPTGATRDVTSVSFANPQVGWLGTETPLTTDRHYKTGPGQVRRTTDGGQTWTAQGIGENVLSVLTPQVVAISPTEAYVSYGLTGRTPAPNFFYIRAAPVLRHTVDGGRTWPEVILNNQGGYNYLFSFQPPVFTTATTGYLAVNSEVPAQLVSQLLRTADAGRTWQDILPAVGPGLDPLKLTFLTPQLGWLVAADFATNTTRLYKTVNGGGAWAQVASFAFYYPFVPIVSFSFADPLRGLLVVRESCYRTTDGGLTWALVPGRFSANSPLSVALSRQQATRLLPGGAGWAVGAAGGIYRTSDYGGTWQSRSTLAPVRRVVNLNFSGPACGWAVPSFYDSGSGTTLLRTTRRGAPWQPVRIDGALPGLTAVNGTILGAAFPDADTGWVVGYSGLAPRLVLRTTDAGRTWANQALGTAPSYIDAIGCWDTRRATIASLTEHTLYTTRNGGQRWAAAPNPAPRRYLWAITWTDSATVYIPTDSAVYLLSRDAGRSWRALPTPGGDNLLASRPCFTSAAVGYWAAGRGLWQTTDGGRTWRFTDLEAQSSPMRENGFADAGLYAVSFRNARNGWAFGRNDVFQTQDAGRTWTLVANVQATTGQASGGPSVLIDRYNAFTTGTGIVRYSEKFVQADTLAAQPRRYCAGQALTLAYTTEGTLTPAERAGLRLQLSNKMGRFRQGETWLLAPAPGGTATALRATLPAVLPAGSRYRLRVITADSALLGGDNQRDLTIDPLPAAVAVAPAGPQSLCAGASLTLSAPAGAAQYLWNTGATTRTLAVTAGGSYSVQVAGAAGCFGPPSAAVAVATAPVPAVPVLAHAPGGPVTVVAPAAGIVYAWFLGGAVQPGVSGPRFPASGPAGVGTYTAVAVSAAPASCRSGVSAATVVVLAVGGALPPGWAVYPVPADERLVVEMATGGAAATLTLFDALGRTVQTATTAQPNSTLDVRQVPTGFYTLRVALPGGKVLTQPVQVQH